MKNIKFLISLFIVISILTPYIGYAISLEQPIEYKNSLDPNGLKNAKLGNCFDVYKFGNINLDITLDKSEYETTDGIILTGSIENKNNYPLPDLKIIAKIVRITEEDNRKIVKTVDEIVLKGNINLGALGKQDINEIYNMPIQVAKGDYEILFSVIQNDKINIAGLSFTDDVYAINPRFSIKGDNIEEIVIKQKDIKVNGNIYNNLNSHPSYKEKVPVEIEIPIQNNSDEDKELYIEYEVYSWSDSLGKVDKKLIQQTTIAKKGTSTANYIIEEKDINKAVYYIKVKVKDIDTSESMRWINIANIRFNNEYINEPRIAFTGFNTTPSAPEGDLKLLTCLHNTNDSGVDTILENIVKDNNGQVIASSEYKGLINGQIDGVYTSLPKGKKYNNLIVTSTIKDKDGNILNSMELKYDCQNLNPSKCIDEKSKTPWLSIIVIIIISLIIVSLFGYRKYNSKIIKY